MTHRFTGPGLVGAAALALAATFCVAPAARAEVPVPRLPPDGGYTAASVSEIAPTLEAMAPAATIEEQIEREATVDVSFAVAALYKSRGFAPIWNGERAATLRARLAEAAGDGLDPEDYEVPAGLGRASEDVALTEAALRYARHAHSGRIVPTTVSRLMLTPPPPFSDARFLRRLSRARNIGRVLESVHPQHPQYQALRARLRAILANRVDAPPAVGPGPALKEGTTGRRVAVLRSRMALPEGETFDGAVLTAVKAFQSSRGLRPDGIVGPRTLALLDEKTAAESTAALVSNLERWRWMPRWLGHHHVFVSVPGYRVQVVTDGRADYSGRVIVGQPSNPTPIFSDEIEHIVVNPYWNVPFSIASNEMLNAIRANPSGYFARRNYEVVSRGKVVDPSSVSWTEANLRKVRIRQRPGDGNALGSVKFLFPNDQAVYLHDTPSKGLFSRSSRALSHGCVRVDQPFEFADALLAEEPGLSGAGLKRMVGGSQKWLNVHPHIPVHLTYFTREVTPDGRIVRYDDVYGYDARTQRALGL